MRDKTRSWVKTKKAQRIIVDHLQHFEYGGGKPSRYEMLTRISPQLKSMAKELNVPVLVLAQVHRESERDNRRPRIHDLRESGAIEQDADMIMMLHEHEEATNEDMKIDVIGSIDKQRQGQRGEIVFRLYRRFCRFQEKGNVT